MTAHLPDQQWDLILQSLRASGNNESQLNNIPAAVVVEAGVLVWTYMQTCSTALRTQSAVHVNPQCSKGGSREQADFHIV